MIARSLLMLGLAALMFGCGPAAPETAAPQEEQPTVDIPATVAVMVAEQAISTPEAPSSEATPEPTSVPPTPQRQPTAVSATPTPTAALPIPTPTTAPSNAVTVNPSAVANELTGGLLVSFTHTVPEYIKWVRGAFIHVEDKNFCEAANMFTVLAEEAKLLDGERLTNATYNAGVIYMAMVWDDPTIKSGCLTYSYQHPNGLWISANQLAARELNSASPHLTDIRQQAAVHLMLGRAYANQSMIARSRFGHTTGGSITLGDAEGEKKWADKAMAHLCDPVITGQFDEAVKIILQQIKRSCN